MTSKQVPRTAVLLAIVAVWLGLTLYAVNSAGVPNPNKYAHEKDCDGIPPYWCQQLRFDKRKSAPKMF
ncbi:hypothetical protein RRG08_000267 [Elysia crispata]|uniref:Uncharacterized protein n=1 Tax=Elysia crispata TaxID=231223 RepID=A0AAE0XW05_9GAST|nr:hypothetical protein RRG08_000267 [Elysia crispata]